eukprot:12361536-Heterocapsa_arctica.AAC.1
MHVGVVTRGWVEGGPGRLVGAQHANVARLAVSTVPARIGYVDCRWNAEGASPPSYASSDCCL